MTIIRAGRGHEYARDKAQAAVDSYVAENGPVLDLYDFTNPGAHDDVTELDLLSLSALNAYPGGDAMTHMGALWKEREEIRPLVKAISSREIEMTAETDLAGQRDAVVAAMMVVERLPGWGSTRAAKLLHRLRPGLIPIWDVVLGSVYGGASETWAHYIDAVWSDVREPTNAAFLAEMQSRIPRRLSRLRIWDFMLWKLNHEGLRR